MSGVDHEGGWNDREPIPDGRDGQAADWCLRLAEGSLTVEERHALDAWLGMPENRAAFEDAVLVWQGAESAAERPEAIGLRTRALESFRSLNRQRWGSRHRRRGWRWPLTASLSLVVAICVLWLLRDSAQVYETGTGERQVAMLADGSRLSLDAASRVEVRMGRQRRELRLLEGRAKFDVAKDALRPFSVAVDDKLVVAVGTSFSVERVRQKMHVVLYEGKVEVLEKARAGLLSSTERPSPLHLPHGQALKPGHELVVGLNAKRASDGDHMSSPPSPRLPRATVATAPEGAARLLSWEAGQLNFNNESLVDAVERMNRYTSRKLVVLDPAVGGLKINGVFTAGDTSAFVEGVTQLLPVDAVQQEATIELVRR